MFHLEWGFSIGETMNTKICTKCGKEKAANTEFFHKQRGGKYGLAATCKGCVKIYHEANKEKILKRRKQYYEANKEKISKRKREYRKANKDKIAEYDKQYRKANKDKVAERQKQYREANKEKIKQYLEANKNKISKQQKQYCEANKEKIAEYRKQHRKKNGHLYRQWQNKRRAAKLNQTPDYANLDLIKLIYKYCPDDYEVDHMIPLANGGLHHESNLCYLPKCVNRSKGANTIEEFGEEEFNKHVIYWQDILHQLCTQFHNFSPVF
jgi:DNA repair exonuclease SbcCD ATPase subunit